MNAPAYSQHRLNQKEPRMVNMVTLILCGFILMFGNCIIIGNGASIATSTAEDKANASAMMNFINVGMVVVGTFVLAVTPGSPIIKLPVGFLLAMLVMSVVWFSFIQPRKENRP